jgi:superfamily II DNA or RNA helicase
MPAAAPVLPLVPVDRIVALVGPAAYQRAVGYQREGRVDGDSMVWNAADAVLSGRVRGTRRQPYAVWVFLDTTRPGPPAVTGTSCTCPVGGRCKHCAALLLESNALAVREMPGVGKASATKAPWRAALDQATRPEPSPTAWDPAAEHPTQLALQLRLEEDASPDTLGHRVLVRPAKPGRSGRWVASGLNWYELATGFYAYSGFEADALEWMRSLARLRGLDFGRAAWVPLADFDDPLLFAVLARAAEAGVPLVGQAPAPRVELAREAALTLDVRALPDGGIELTRRVTFDGRTATPSALAAISRRGLAALIEPATSGRAETATGADAAEPAPLGRDAEPHLLLAPTSRPLSQRLTELSSSLPLRVPPADAADFLAGYLPALRRFAEVASRDGSVAVPEASRAELVLAVTVTTPPARPRRTADRPAARRRTIATPTARLAWRWAYGDWQTPTEAPTHHDPRRDAEAEAQVLREVRPLLAAHPFLPHPQAEADPAAPARAAGLDLAELITEVIPAIKALPHVRADVKGTLPRIHDLTEAPRLEVAARATDSADWFDLDVIVTVGGHEVPFVPLFEALARGDAKLLLADGGLLPLDRPELARLRELIDEARRLSDKPGQLRLSRYQSSLWNELDDLADTSSAADEWRASVAGLAELSRTGAAPQAVAPPAGLRADLRAYQARGLDWLAFCWNHRLGGVLADDMGLGKTVQALALVAYARDQAPAGATPAAPFLVVTPSSVIGTWLGEAAKFTPHLTVRTLTATRKRAGVPMARAIAGADVVVTSYAIFRLDAAEFEKTSWAGLILDEAQFAKNPATQTNQLARRLRTPYKLAITGTPMENSLTELWAVLAIATPGLFPSAGRFRDDYIKPITGDDPVLRVDRLDRLRKRLRPVLLRRTKEEVAPELPPRTEQVLRLDLEPKHRRVYDTFLHRERQRVLGLLDNFEQNRFAVLRSLTVLRRMALDASLVDPAYAGTPSSKLNVLVEHLDEVIGSGHRALVFSQFTSYLQLIAQRAEADGVAYSYLDGTTRHRSRVIDGFKQGTQPLFLISLKAGGFGLNLTEADYVFLMDPWWNPATENQAIDRAHRIGQDKPVLVTRLVAADTIEDKVMALKEKKAALFDAVLDDDGTFSSELSADDIRALLE